VCVSVDFGLVFDFVVRTDIVRSFLTSIKNLGYRQKKTRPKMDGFFRSAVPYWPAAGASGAGGGAIGAP
jgi:hypothetical protein